MGGFALTDPLTLPPEASPLPPAPRRGWTWFGALLFLAFVFACQFVAVFAAGTALELASRAGFPSFVTDWAMTLLSLIASLSTLLLLLSQRGRSGAKPLWDPADLKDWRGWALALSVLGGCALANVIRMYISPDASTPALNQEVLALVQNAATVPWAQLLTVGFTIVVLAPLTEEWLFRGILQQALGVRWSQWLAVPVTAVIFGLMHGLDVWWVPAIYGAGIGLLANRQRSLALPMLVHGALNLGVFLLLLSAA